MSSESCAEILFRKNGMRTSCHSKIKWQGSIEKCWDLYVDKFKIKKEGFIPNYGKTNYYDRKSHHEVYMMTCKVNNKTYIKIGVSQRSEMRMKNQKTSFPFGEWSLIKVVYVKDVDIAKTCEFNMLVSCAHLNVGGEWIYEE